MKRVAHPHRPSSHHHRHPVVSSDVSLDFNEPSALSFINNKHDEKNVADILVDTSPKKDVMTPTRKNTESSGGEANGGFAANLYNNLMSEDANIIGKEKIT